MFGKAAILIAMALQVPIVTIPLQRTPRHNERVVAPIEQAGPAYAQACAGKDGWDDPAPPVRIHGNTYFVGTCGISAILVTGSAGHILIDAGTENGADLIADNIRELGFDLADVQVLLHSHEHRDHVGGMARLQQLTGGQLVASAPAAGVFTTGAANADDPQAGMEKPFPAVARISRVIKDGEHVRLGNLDLVAIATPGHTPGALSWTWGSCDGGVCRRIVYADSLTPVSRDDYKFSGHPDVVAAFRASFDKLRKVDCEILLTPHPSASEFRRRLSAGVLNPDATACQAYVDGLSQRLGERLAMEAAGK
jgi:metallo-beta-lactamase class B